MVYNVLYILSSQRILVWWTGMYLITTCFICMYDNYMFYLYVWWQHVLSVYVMTTCFIPCFYRDAHSTLPIKRLWFYLIKQEPLKEVFIRYIFRKKVNQSEVSVKLCADWMLTFSDGSRCQTLYWLDVFIQWQHGKW